MKNRNIKNYITFIILIVGAGSIYRVTLLKDVFYIPMQEFMGLTHTQIGLAMSLYGATQFFGNFFSIYVADRFSKKLLIPIGLIGTGIIGCYVSTFPPYTAILICWILFSVTEECIFWPVLLKTVKLIGSDNNQGRFFSLLEAGRGIMDIFISYLGLQVFILLSKTEFALKISIIFFSVITIIIGIISYFMLEDDAIVLKNNNNNFFSSIKEVFSNKYIWIVSINIFCVYAVYCGITYFIPFLKEIYGMPVVLVSIYGIINQYGLKIVGGSIAGVISDKIFRSPSRYMNFAFIILTIMLGIFIIIPHSKVNQYIYIGMTIALLSASIIFSLRAIYFAPMSEIQIPIELTGGAMAMGCIIGYAPRAFMFFIYGSILDNNPGILGYRIVFLIMFFIALLGIISSFILKKMIKNNKI